MKEKLSNISIRRVITIIYSWFISLRFKECGKT